MRPQDEVDLVGRANNICERMKLAPKVNVNLSHEGFYEMLRDDAEMRSTLVRLVSEIGNEKLGATIGTRLANSGEYGKRNILATVPMAIIVDGEVYGSGREQLLKLAIPVIVAAMYDILATEAILRERSSYKSEIYVPKPAMIKFVAKNRLRQDAGALVRAARAAAR